MDGRVVSRFALYPIGGCAVVVMFTCIALFHVFLVNNFGPKWLVCILVMQNPNVMIEPFK
jgi:hypothetical protein